jgi:hypothetical protein
MISQKKLDPLLTILASTALAIKDLVWASFCWTGHRPGGLVGAEIISVA